MGNNTLDWLAGSETWTLTLGTELKRLGHEIQAYSPQLGFIAMQMEALGIKCVSELKKQSTGAFKFQLALQDSEGFEPDIIICSHNQITKDLHAAFPNTPIIAVVHGIIHKDPETSQMWPEHPVTEFKVDQYVAVSQEVQALLKEVYGIESVIITNFFDLEKFKWSPIPPTMDRIMRKPLSFLVNSNYLDRESNEVQIIKAVADHYDAQLKAIGQNFTGSWDLQDVIKNTDVVVGMGRSVLEGFVMGKIALVHGRWGTGGVL
ncbi:MAG TPA: glycosyltransferase, partial [Anaerolineales bacterium]|nr:glycosyltransferase [Anaerolineales bacterium]